MRKIFKSKRDPAHAVDAVNAVIEEYRKGSPSSDPMGMYTGVPEASQTPARPDRPEEQAAAGHEKPTQDADDL